VIESPLGQRPQALTYVPDSSPDGSALNLQPLGLAGMAFHLSLASPGWHSGSSPTSVALFDQGLTQVLEASVTGLAPKQAYVLALSTRADGSGPLQSLASFTTNPAGAAIVNAVGPIRQVIQGGGDDVPRRYLVIAGADGGTAVQVQVGR
jgi:hypothetical protein